MSFVEERTITLLASAAQTASGTSIPLFDCSCKRGTILLDLTAAGSIAGDTLDVYIQKNVGPDSVPVWTDWIHFTQALGNGGAKQFVVEFLAESTVTAALHVVQDGVLAAGVNQGPVGRQFRVKWVIVNGGGTHSFTFSVTAHLINDN